MDKALELTIQRLASSVGAMNGDSGSPFAGFTCFEADEFAVVLALPGHLGAAAIVITLHAEDDDCTQHELIGAECERQAQLGVSPTEGRARRMAREYVQGLVQSLRDAGSTLPAASCGDVGEQDVPLWYDADRIYAEMALASYGSSGLIAGWEPDAPSGGYKVVLHGTEHGWVLRSPEMASSFVAAMESALRSGKVGGPVPGGTG